MSKKGFRVEIPINIKSRGAPTETPSGASEPNDVPRIARLLALAHKWEGMVRRGEKTLSEIAQQHGLSRSRVTQICNLTLIAPEVQLAELEARACQLHLLAHQIHVVSRLPTWRAQVSAPPRSAPRWSDTEDPTAYRSGIVHPC
jgi:hypothetical protein